MTFPSLTARPLSLLKNVEEISKYQNASVAWVAITSEDSRIAICTAELLKSGVKEVDWEEYHLSYVFVVESTLIFALF